MLPILKASQNFLENDAISIDCFRWDKFDIQNDPFS
jgi:hypothetical protein